MLRRYLATLATLCSLLIIPAVVADSQTSASAELTIGRCWAYPVSGRSLGFTAAGARIYIGAEGSKISALTLDGKLAWTTELGGEISSNLLADETGLYVVTSSTADAGRSTSKLRSLSSATGITNWSSNLPSADRYSLGSFGATVIVTAQSGAILAINAAGGEVKWTRELADGFVAQPFFGEDRVFVAARGKQIFTVSLDSGEVLAMRRSEHAVTALAGLPSGVIALGDERGNIVTLNGTDKAVWRFKSGGAVSDLIPFGGSLLAASHDNFLYFLTIRNGDVDWKRRLPGRVYWVGIVDGRHVIAFGTEDTSAVITDLSTGKVAGQIPFGDKETPVAQPLSHKGSLFVLTDEAAYSYSFSGCPGKK